MVTVEAAIAIGSLVAVLAVVLAAVGAVIAQIRCVDAAGEAARRASRDDTAGAEALARDLPAGTEVRVEPEGALVRIRVRVPPLGGAVPGLRLSAEAVAAREPAVAAPTGDADEAVPDNAVPDNAVPDNAVPDNAVPDNAVPAEPDTAAQAPETPERATNPPAVEAVPP